MYIQILYKYKVGIPIGTSCALIVAEMFLLQIFFVITMIPVIYTVMICMLQLGWNGLLQN